MPQDLVLVGIFGAAHGVRGEVRLKSYTGDPLALADYPRLTDESGKATYKILSARLIKDDILVARLEGVADRTAAEKLTNHSIYIARTDLPPADEDEFYHADLIGLRVETRDGALIGTIADVQNFGAGDILDVHPPLGENLFLPFTRKVVPIVDMAARRVIVDMPDEVIVREDETGEDEA